MSIQLYKDGSTHVIRGVECEMHVFPNDHLHSALLAGFVANPKDVPSYAAKVDAEAKAKAAEEMKSEAGVKASVKIKAASAKAGKAESKSAGK